MNFAADGADRRNALDDGVSVRRFDGKEGLNALREAWNRLAQSLQSSWFFHLHGWYRSYLEALEPDPQSVHFFVLYRDGSPVAIFPLKYSTRRLRGVLLRSLEFPQHEHLNLCDAVFERSSNNEGLVRILVSHLRGQSDLLWDVLYLSRIVEDSAVAFSLNAAPPPCLIPSRRGFSRYVKCLDSPEAMGERLAGSFRRNLRRLERRAQEAGKLEYRSYRSVQELSPAFAAFLEVEASGWKGTQGQGTAITCDASLRAFYTGLVEHCLPGGEPVINLLWLNDSCIAGQFGLLVDRVLYIIKIGYHENYAHLAPGNLLMERVLADGGRDPTMRAISFVTDPPWSHLWRPESRLVSNYYIFNRTLRGLASYLAHRVRAPNFSGLRTAARTS